MYLFIPDNAHSSKGTHVTAHPSTFASRLNSGERQELAKSTAPTVTPVNNVVKCSITQFWDVWDLQKRLHSLLGWILWRFKPPLWSKMLGKEDSRVFWQTFVVRGSRRRSRDAFIAIESQGGSAWHLISRSLCPKHAGFRRSWTEPLHTRPATPVNKVISWRGPSATSRTLAELFEASSKHLCRAKFCSMLIGPPTAKLICPDPLVTSLHIAHLIHLSHLCVRASPAAAAAAPHAAILDRAYQSVVIHFLADWCRRFMTSGQGR